MSLVCPQCGFSNPDGVEQCQNPAPLATGKHCDAILSAAPADPVWIPSSPSGGGPPPTVTLTPEWLAIGAGTQRNCELRVRNQGDVDDTFEIFVLIPAATWVTATPATLTLEPAAEGVVRLTLRPPLSSEVRAGPVAVTVGARPKSNPSQPALAEVKVEVGRYLDLGAKLQPMHSDGRLGGSHHLVVVNKGNVPVQVEPEGEDPDRRVGIAFKPRRQLVEPGSTAQVKVGVRPRKPIWWAQPPQRRPFEVVVRTEPKVGSTSTEGVFLQRPVFPVRPLMGVVLLVALLAVLLGVSTAAVMVGGRISSAPTPQVSAQLPSPSPSPTPTPSPPPSPSPTPSPTPDPSPTPAPSPLPSPPAGVVAFNNGVPLPTGQCISLDTGAVDCGVDYDLYSPAGYKYMAPDNGATTHGLGVLNDSDFAALDSAALRKLSYDLKPITHPSQGEAFAVKTVGGNYAKVQVLSVLPDGWTLRYTTYAGS